MSVSRTKYLVKNTLIFTIGSVATKFINFILVPLYTNVLSTSEYGTVDLINTICMVLAPITILNINEGVMRFCLDKNSDKNSILLTGIRIYGISLLISLLIFPVNSFFSSTAQYSIYIYIYTVTLAGSQLIMGYLRGIEKLVHYTIGNIIHTLLLVAFNILFLVVMKLGIEGYFLSYIFSSIITTLYACIAGKLWTTLKKNKIDKKLAKQMIKFSVVLIPNTFMWWIMNSSDRVMVTSMVDVSANGIYAVAYKIPSLVVTFTTLFNQAWSYSAIKENGAKDEAEFNSKVFRNYVSIVMFVGIGLMIISKPFLSIYVSKEYYEAWKFTPPLILGFVYLTLASFMATSYTVHKDSIGFLLSGMFGAILNIILNFLLIPIIGTMGAALATCVSYISVFAFRQVHTRKYIKYQIMNVNFIVGSLLLIISSAFVYWDNYFAYIFQFIIIVAAGVIYRNVWLSFVKKIKGIFKKKK